MSDAASKNTGKFTILLLGPYLYASKQPKKLKHKVNLNLFWQWANKNS